MFGKKPIRVKDESEIMSMVTGRQKRRAMIFGRWPIGWFLRDGCRGPLKLLYIQSSHALRKLSTRPSRAVVSNQGKHALERGLIGKVLFAACGLLWVAVLI